MNKKRKSTNEKQYTEDTVWNPVMMWIIYCREVFCNRKSKPYCCYNKKRIQMKCEHAECCEINPGKVVSPNGEKKREKVECCNGDKYSACNEKPYIGIFGRVFYYTVVDILDFWHIFI